MPISPSRPKTSTALPPRTPSARPMRWTMRTGFVTDSLFTGHRMSIPSRKWCALERADCGRNRSAIGGALPFSFRAVEAGRWNLLCRGMASSENPSRALPLRRVSPPQFLVMLGHCFGAKPAPCGSASFCFGCAAPSGLGSSQNKFVSAAKNAAQTSSGPRQESTPWHLGAGPTRWLCQG